MMQFEEIALVVVLTTSVFLVATLLWGRYSSVRLAVPDKPSSSSAQQRGDDVDPSTLGKVGELVTALMHANDGWRRLSAPSTVDGLDGIFVRKRGGRNQFEVRIVETTCTRGDDPKANYRAEQLADVAVIEQLERLKASATADDADGQAVEAIIKALRRGSVRVTKHYYAHMLGSGNTVVYSVGRDGQLVERAARVKRFNGQSHRLMLQALSDGLARASATAS